MLSRPLSVTLSTQESSRVEKQAAATGLFQIAQSVVATQPVLRAANARVTIDEEKIEQTTAVDRFSASASFESRREFEKSGTTLPFTSTSTGLQGTLPIYRPQSASSIDAARFQFESTRALRLETESDLLAAVASTYFLAALQATETRTLVAERQLLSEQRTVNERRLQGGVGTLVEVLETAARVDTLKGQVRGSEGAEKNLLAELGRLAGAPVDLVLTLRDESPAVVVPQHASVALRAAETGSARLVRLRRTLESARANIDVQRGAQLPTIDLVANVDRTRFQFDSLSTKTPSSALGVRISLPIFSGGATQSRIREALAQTAISEEDVRGAELTLRSDITKAYADLETAKSQASSNANGLAISQSALEATMKAFRAGVRSNIDVLNAQQQTFASQRELMRSRVAIQLAQTRILSLMGTLNLDSIALLARSLREGK
ncbi:MAG: TolC family protein [Usitatibacteraceae bacterium]